MHAAGIVHHHVRPRWCARKSDVTLKRWQPTRKDLVEASMLHGNVMEHPADYRMLAIDLDGTLLRKDGTMGDRTRLALQAAVRQGIKVVICTGRRFRTTLPILAELELAVPVIVHGGLLIKDAGTYETLYHNYLATDFALEAV